MKTLLLAALLLVSGGAVPAAPAHASDRLAACPQRGLREDATAYGARTHNYCRSRWDAMLRVRRTGGQTHDEFVDGCLRRCIADSKGAPLDWFVGGVWGATLAYGLTAGDGGGSKGDPAAGGGVTTSGPPPPPASP